jgi:hypothetical protein
MMTNSPALTRPCRVLMPVATLVALAVLAVTSPAGAQPARPDSARATTGRATPGRPDSVARPTGGAGGGVVLGTGAPVSTMGGLSGGVVERSGRTATTTARTDSAAPRVQPRVPRPR